VFARVSSLDMSASRGILDRRRVNQKRRATSSRDKNPGRETRPHEGAHALPWSVLKFIGNAKTD
jgi:hypothetical protein